MSRARGPVAAAPAAGVGAPAGGSRTASLTGGLHWRAPYLLPALLLLGTRLALWIHTPWASEDALITFRFAWNWAHGLGPVFNAGERVFGYTSPPWMAWIALGIRIGADPVGWSRATLLLIDLSTLIVLTSTIDRHASRASAWCFAFFFSVYPYFSGLLSSGLETGAMVGLIALTAWLQERRHPAAGASLGLLAVFRPEGLLAALVLAVWARGRDRVVAAAIGAVVAVGLTLYYGSPIPQSLLAKAAVYGTPGPFGAQQWWEWALPLPLVPATSEGKLFAALCVLASPAAVAGLAQVWSRRRTALAATIAGLAIVWLALLSTGATYFFWYLSPPLLAWVLLACVGLPRIVQGPHVYVAAALMVAGYWLQAGKFYSSRARVEAARFGTVADYLARNARAGDVVVLEPIGTVGWRCRDLRLIDEVGLVSPEVSKRRRQGRGWYADLLVERRPQWAVIRAKVLQSSSAYAGVGDPFRDLDDERRALAPYGLAAQTDSVWDDATLCVLRRARDAR